MFELDDYIKEQYDAFENCKGDLRNERYDLLQNFSESFKYYFDIIKESKGFKYLKWKNYKIIDMSYSHSDKMIEYFEIEGNAKKVSIIADVVSLGSLATAVLPIFPDIARGMAVFVLGSAVIISIVAHSVSVGEESTSSVTTQYIYKEHGIDGLVELHNLAKQEAYNKLPDLGRAQHELDMLQANKMVFDQ